MYSIIEDIKSGSLKKVYLLYGTEQFLVHTYRDKLVKACTGKDISELDGDMNFARFAGVGTDIKAVSESAQTMPFFADRRVIVLDGTEWFKKSNDEVVKFLTEIPETGCVILLGANPIAAQIMTQIAQVFVLPLIIILMQILVNRRSIMGEHRAGVLLNIGMTGAFLFSLVISGTAVQGLVRLLGM